MRKAHYCVRVISVLLFIIAGSTQLASVYASENLPTLISSNSSFNYSVCNENQNKNVIMATDAKTVKDSTRSYPTVLAARTISSQYKPASLNPDIILGLINKHRSDIGLPSFEKDANLCKLAVERGPEAYNEAYKTGAIHAGLYARNLPYWVTENMKYGTNENSAVEWWLTSSIHKKAIESNARYSCGECYGDVCIQLFTNYVPK